MKNNNNDMRINSLYALGILDTGPDERFDRLTRLAVEIFKVPIALISLVDNDKQWFKSSCGINLQSTPISDSFCSFAVESGAPYVIEDTFSDPRFILNNLVCNDPFIRSYAGYPVKLPDGEIAGAICIIDTKPREFTSKELNHLKDLAGIVEDEFKIINIATTDSLTGICNRRSFRLILDEVFKNNRKKMKKFSVIIIDLNKFKPINDTYGHAEGNAALCAFSNILENLSYDNSFVARLGGDEFGAILSDSSHLGATAFINELKSDLQKYNNESGKPYLIDFTAGAVEYDFEKHTTVSDILIEADRDMYDKKHNVT
ncbi:Diguanylate cyclase [Erwinia rhapontici]|uniref:sensor domain-containing diguanylate cyclase n=1 Tax=Erwinia rhapontici TaxID=55212 RepID=UPI003D35FD4B